MLDGVGIDGQPVDRRVAIFAVLLRKNLAVHGPATSGGTEVGMRGAIHVRGERSAARAGYNHRLHHARMDRSQTELTRRTIFVAARWSRCSTLFRSTGTFGPGPFPCAASLKAFLMLATATKHPS